MSRMWRHVAGSNFWRLREYVLLKSWKPVTQLYSVISQKIWIHKKNLVRLWKMFGQNGWRIFVCFSMTPRTINIHAACWASNFNGCQQCGMHAFWFLSVLFKNTFNMLRQYSSGDWWMSVEHYHGCGGTFWPGESEEIPCEGRGRDPPGDGACGDSRVAGTSQGLRQGRGRPFWVTRHRAAILSDIIMNENIKLLQINYLVQKLDVFFKFFFYVTMCLWQNLWQDLVVILAGKNKITLRKILLPLCPQQIPHGPAWDVVTSKGNL